MLAIGIDHDDVVAARRHTLKSHCTHFGIEDTRLAEWVELHLIRRLSTVDLYGDCARSVGRVGTGKDIDTEILGIVYHDFIADKLITNLIRIAKKLCNEWVPRITDRRPVARQAHRLKTQGKERLIIGNRAIVSIRIRPK